MRFWRKAVFDPASNHHFNKPGLINIADSARGHIFAIAQNRDAVTYLKNLFEMM
ncbi:hypothetical protein D3C72_2287740 [compost metagenome]